MTRFLCLAAAVALVAAPSTGQSNSSATPSVADLSGLWGAKKWFGPDVRGQLIVERVGGHLRADVAGRSALVTQKGQELAFDLPGNEGSFRGRFEGTNVIRGHWMRPPDAISFGQTAFPVVLKAIGPGQSIRARRNFPFTFSLAEMPTAPMPRCSGIRNSTSAIS
jgi:hypothetical protein